MVMTKLDEAATKLDSISKRFDAMRGRKDADTDMVEAYGRKGMKDTRWRRVFKNHAAMEKWLEDNDAEAEGTRTPDPGARVGEIR